MTSDAELDALVAGLPIERSSMIWATLSGRLLSGVLPASAIWIGAPIIVASGRHFAWREQSLRRDREATMGMLR